ncbi:hypothetical protein LJ655_21825 [Paraburkholderia sp. MMS20-SJTN17]|uniref:Uncharacterized protein n=1 Tax=Paraburkholderia translucens TaxID=2886945 RepID=A0ABS8KJB2_9BURK|nr:hypothetical protein [Paraburkholderia sp. MMS20-SJTN17]MCC8404487.1 hypothetical protein [Paraburkholderia sp. MMS20-SJTN17]
MTAFIDALLSVLNDGKMPALCGVFGGLAGETDSRSWWAADAVRATAAVSLQKNHPYLRKAIHI